MVTKKYIISLQSLAKYAQLWPNLSILDFISIMWGEQDAK